MKLIFPWKGQDYKIQAQWVRGVLWIHANGRIWSWDPAAEARATKRGSGSAKKDGTLLAPMPGKVTKILKQVGEAVRKGDVVLVMEAMKMEYSLKADLAGRVQELHCGVGEQVNLGVTLARIEAEVAK